MLFEMQNLALAALTGKLSLPHRFIQGVTISWLPRREESLVSRDLATGPLGPTARPGSTYRVPMISPLATMQI
ncbi:hypothetical protein SRHO_G00014250 [Serrasalmus rhombeus]